MKNEVGEHFL